MELRNLLNSDPDERHISSPANRLNSVTPPYPPFSQSTTPPPTHKSPTGFGLPHFEAPISPQQTMQDWPRGTNNNGSGLPYSAPAPVSPFKSIKNDPILSPTRQLSQPSIDARSAKPVHGVQAALNTIDRYKNGMIKSDISVKEGPLYDFEVPVILAGEAFENPPPSWAGTWKPELLEKMHYEIYIKDQKNSKDMKKRISEFREHTENMQSDDEIWFARDIPVMHQLSCINSKKNRNCMGCSAFWKSVQTIQEDIRPWGNNDILHFEPEHSETFKGHIGMNGSFTPTQRDLLACDSANTLFYADDPNAIAIWGLIPPTETNKLTEDDCLGVHFYDQKTFIDPAFIEKKVRVIYGIQRVGQTIVVPSMWSYWVVRMGRGLTFSGSWNFLRARNIIDARKQVEFNRSFGLYCPINLSSALVVAAYQKLDDLESSEPQDRREISDTLIKILPVLKTIILEDLLGENINISGLAVLSYENMVERLKKNLKKLPSNTAEELMHIRNSIPANSTESDILEEDDETLYSCSHCKYILYSARRTCLTCKYDLCESCFAVFGKLHPHKMKRYRKNPVQKHIELVDSISEALHDREEYVKSSPPARNATVATTYQDDTKPTLLPKQNTQQSQVQQHQQLMDLDLRDTKRRRRDANSNNNNSNSKKESDGPDNYDQEVIDCICGNNKDLGFMISCEKCYAWLHGKCVGISKRNEPEVYYCPRCVKKNSALHAVAKLSPKSFSPERKLREYKLA